MVDVVLRVLQVAKPLLVVKVVAGVEHCVQVVAAIVVMAPVAVVASVLVVIPAPLVVTLLVIILAPALVIALVLQVAQMIVPVLALGTVKAVLLHVKMIVLVVLVAEDLVHTAVQAIAKAAATDHAIPLVLLTVKTTVTLDAMMDVKILAKPLVKIHVLAHA